MAAPSASAIGAARLRIGITGHRRHRLKVPDRVLMRRLSGVVETFRGAGQLSKAAKSLEIEIVSALAEGADELAARVALSTGCRLIAVLPFAPKDYETTFSDKGYKREFRDLMKKAHECIVLPGTLRERDAGFEAVGIAMLARADVVVAIWDGAAAQGRGGTPEILQLALQRRLPMIWIDAVVDRAPFLLQRSRSGPCPHLERLAPRAKPFLKSDAARLLGVK